MIELPSDLAEVLKVVQSNEHGASVVFPDANEDLLEELAAAWEAWNAAAEPAVRTITASANRAMANMSGAAAESFEGYLRKYAGSDQSHAATTLDAGTAMAQSLRGAQQAVTQTKSEMVRELQYAKEYMEQNPAGKHDDIAQSEGIKTAADTYNTYVGQVGSSIDTMLRQSAGHVERMTGAGQVAQLGGSGDSGTSTTGAGGPLAVLDPSSLRHPNTTGLDSLQAGAVLPGTDAGPLSGQFDPSVGGFGGGAGGGAGAYRPQPGSLQPFQPPAPASFSGGFGGGGSLGSGGGGAPIFSPDNAPRLGLAGLPGFTSGAGGGGGGSAGTITPWSPPAPSTGGLSGSLGGGSFGGLGGLGGGAAGAGRSTAGAFKPSGLGGGGMPMGSAAARGLGGAGGASGRGLTTQAGLGVAGAAESGMRSGSGLGQGSGAGVGRGGTGAAGAVGGRATGAGGMAGAHGPGGMGGGGRGGDKRSGNRFVRPTRFGAAGPEDEDDALLTDSSITGQAAQREGGDRHWEHMRRRWLDAARAEGHIPQSQTATAGTEAPGEQNTLLNQLTAALLGPDAGAEGAEALTNISGESTSEGITEATGSGTGTGGADSLASTGDCDRSRGSGEGDTRGAGTFPSADEDYLDRARAAAARRGRPDGDGPAASGTTGAGDGAGRGGSGAEPMRAPIREEGGYQVPSPFLRAALARLATSGDRAGAPGGASGS